jgi:hypothetical protein
MKSFAGSDHHVMVTSGVDGGSPQERRLRFPELWTGARTRFFHDGHVNTQEQPDDRDQLEQ